jgi:hypothetical protein
MSRVNQSVENHPNSTSFALGKKHKTEPHSNDCSHPNAELLAYVRFPKQNGTIEGLPKTNIIMVSTRRQRAKSESSKENSESDVSVNNEEESVTRVDDKKKDTTTSLDKIAEEDGGKPENDNDAAISDDDDDEDDELDSEQQVKREKREKKKHRKREAKKREKNELTKLIPGYTAPMKLNTSSLDQYRPAGGIKELQRRAERTDASTKHFVVEASKKHTDAMQNGSDSSLPTSYAAAYSSFKQGKKRAPDNTAGKGWFGMEPTPMTDELKTDLAVIRNRNYLDPKKFYKSADKHHKIVQLGTVIEGATEFYSSRLTKKQRRNNFTEEIMADPASADYAKKKFKKMAQEKTSQAQKRSHKPKKGKKFF